MTAPVPEVMAVTEIFWGDFCAIFCGKADGGDIYTHVRTAAAKMASAAMIRTSEWSFMLMFLAYVLAKFLVLIRLYVIEPASNPIVTNSASHCGK